MSFAALTNYGIWKRIHTHTCLPACITATWIWYSPKKKKKLLLFTQLFLFLFLFIKIRALFSLCHFLCFAFNFRKVLFYMVFITVVLLYIYWLFFCISWLCFSVSIESHNWYYELEFILKEHILSGCAVYAITRWIRFSKEECVLFFWAKFVFHEFVKMKLHFSNILRGSTRNYWVTRL